MALNEAQRAALRRALPPDAILTSEEDLLTYGYDGTWLVGRPDAVALPTTREQVVALARFASQHRVPLVGRGAATGLAGSAVPHLGGVVVSFARMNRILEVDPEDMVAVVQPGVVTADLQVEVARCGLFFPPDPASLKQSTVGGNVACGAGGPRGLKYGVTKDYVLGLEVVLIDGTVMRVGGRTMKDVTGYNLVQLFTGSEGTLGLVTEITFRLIPQPKARRTALAGYLRIEDAATSVNAVFAHRLLPSTIEIMDNTCIRTVENVVHAGLPADAEAVLLIEVDGDEQDVAARLEEVRRVCQEHGASEVRVATSDADNEQLWAARRSVSASFGQLRPNKMGEDIAVPRSQIVEAVRRIRAISERYGLPIPVFGHISDGNLHPNILFDKSDPEEFQRVMEAAGDIFRLAIELGGTLSGEHGIGLLKRDYLPLALDPAALRLMREIKRDFDPHNLLNPGKVFPPEE